MSRHCEARERRGNPARHRSRVDCFTSFAMTRKGKTIRTPTMRGGGCALFLRVVPGLCGLQHHRHMVPIIHL